MTEEVDLLAQARLTFADTLERLAGCVAQCAAVLKQGNAAKQTQLFQAAIQLLPAVEEAIGAAVQVERLRGTSWRTLAHAIGYTTEGARQRYGVPQAHQFLRKREGSSLRR